MSDIRLCSCDQCGRQEAADRHRVKPDEWYWVSTPRHGPMRHFCTIGCLSLYYSPGRQAIHPDALERA